MRQPWQRPWRWLPSMDLGNRQHSPAQPPNVGRTDGGPPEGAILARDYIHPKDLSGSLAVLHYGDRHATFRVQPDSPAPVLGIKSRIRRGASKFRPKELLTTSSRSSQKRDIRVFEITAKPRRAIGCAIASSRLSTKPAGFRFRWSGRAGVPRLRLSPPNPNIWADGMKRNPVLLAG